MKINLAVAGVVLAVLGLVGCVDAGDRTGERHVSETAQENGHGTIDEAQTRYPTCHAFCVYAYRDCLLAGGDRQSCGEDFEACKQACLED